MCLVNGKLKDTRLFERKQKGIFLISEAKIFFFHFGGH